MSSTSRDKDISVAESGAGRPSGITGFSKAPHTLCASLCVCGGSAYQMFLYPSPSPWAFLFFPMCLFLSFFSLNTCNCFFYLLSAARGARSGRWRIPLRAILALVLSFSIPESMHPLVLHLSFHRGGRTRQRSTVHRAKRTQEHLLSTAESYKLGLSSRSVFFSP